MKELNTVLKGDCLHVLKTLPSNSVDSIVTDPPYELGFMGKSWDSTGIANSVEMWAECLRVLKPGGHLLAFSGTRTYHRMASAIEDAGFKVRDMIEWVYGSGFPKSLNIGKAVDKLQGNKREDLGKSENNRDRSKHEYNSVGNVGSNARLTKGNTEWEGWGTALKPAHEPICMARKPLAEKTVAENCLKYGTGGINIDESRVAANWKEERPESWFNSGKSKSGEPTYDGNLKSLTDSTVGERLNDAGRFPANLIHDNSEEVRDTMMQDYQDPSRFFKSIIYQAKASKSERNKGCEGLEGKNNMRVKAPRENEEEKHQTKHGNNHPTVKPIALMEYLIKMVTPKGGTVLDPFAGSGSTLVAAKQNGFHYIGIEKEQEYIDIINKRLAQ